MERRTPRLVVTLVFAGLVVALAAALVWIRIDLAAARTAAEEREAAMRAAAMHAVSLLSLNHKTVDEDIRRIIATSTRWSPRPVTRPAHSPSTTALPSCSRPSALKNSIAAARSSTTMPTLSIR